MNTHQPLHSVSVAGAIIRDDGRMLVIQRRDNGAWEPPGGVLELGETITDGLKREIREETGLDAEAEHLTGVYKNMARGVVALVFRCRIAGGDLRTGEETKDLRWVSAAEVCDLMDDTYSTRLLDALHTGDVAIREHDGTHLL